MAVITLKNVTKVYRKSHLGRVKETTGVSRMDLAVEKNEIYGLLGLNGSGKTTTIKLIMGLLYPTEGEVEVLGTGMPDIRALKKIGYLPEAAYLNRYLTGRETLELFSVLSGIPRPQRKQAVGAMLEKVGMSESADRRVSEYSKGMLQRISIAQALIHDPDILILDEPVTGLDPLGLREMRQLILWLKAQGKTVFFSSHDISEVEKVSDRVGILAGGKVVLEAPRERWQGREGALEELFVSTARRSEKMGALSFRGE